MAPRPRQPARLADVARDVGVHVSTVSRVLSGRGDSAIRPETKQRIFESAERLRFRPHALARGLRLSTTGALGWLVPSLRNPNNSSIIRGAFDRAWELGYVLVLAEDSDGHAAEEAYARLAGEGRIDGLAIQSARAGNPLLDTFVAGHVPCVFVDRRHAGSGCNVSMRDADAGRLAAEHLLALGHRRLAHLAGPLEFGTTQRRHDGFLAAAREGGVEMVVEVAELTEQAGHDGVLRLLHHPTEAPTGVFVANVNQTIGALAALRREGVAIPGDLSLVCNDDDVLLDYIDPTVTAIRMPLLRLGAAAIDALVARVDGGPPQDVVVDDAPVLVDRGSTGPA